MRIAAPLMWNLPAGLSIQAFVSHGVDRELIADSPLELNLSQVCRLVGGRMSAQATCVELMYINP